MRFDAGAGVDAAVRMLTVGVGGQGKDSGRGAAVEARCAAKPKRGGGGAGCLWVRGCPAC